jgi:hypothetical protein
MTSTSKQAAQSVLRREGCHRGVEDKHNSPLDAAEEVAELPAAPAASCVAGSDTCRGACPSGHLTSRARLASEHARVTAAATRAAISAATVAPAELERSSCKAAETEPPPPAAPSRGRLMRQDTVLLVADEAAPSAVAAARVEGS